MATPQPQPLVTVKKADGSVVRVTLGEFEALKKKSALPPVPPPPLASDNRASDVEKVMKEVGKLVGPDVQNRLRSVIQLFLKDVRDYNETKETLERRAQDGGLGLSKVDADLVLQAVKKITPQPVVSATTFTLKNNNHTVPDLELAETVAPSSVTTREPMIVPLASLPTVTSPNNAFKHSAGTVKKVASAAEVKPQVAPTVSPQLSKKTSAEFDEMLRAVSSSTPLEIHELLAPQPSVKTPASSTPPQSQPRPEGPLRLSNNPEPRPFVRDVAPVMYEVGPIDEIARFTLVDFRRLAQNPAEAAERLKEKFFNLKAESIVLYLQAFEAWHRSPLYLDYVGALVASLAEHRPLSAVLAGKKGIELAEIEAIVAMENDF